MPVVSAVPFELLAVRARTQPSDDAVARAAHALDAAGLAVAVAAHVRRSGALAESAIATGTAMLVAGGAPGALALALGLRGRGLDGAAAVAVLAGALGRDTDAKAIVERPAADPLAVAALAAALGTSALRAAARTHPHLVGPVDGMPVELRYEANRRIALAAGGPFAALARPGRQLLYVDPRRGHAAEVLGDLRRAPHVAVVVPGMANTVHRFSRVLDKAGALRDAARRLHPREELATIAWLGYDSPTVDAVVDDEARTAGPHLARLVAGLGTGGATLTVVGHSYGSLVAGFALRAGLDVDAVAMTGSPGMGANRAIELGTTPLFALAAPLDVVSAIERFGVDPADPEFGATRLATSGSGHAGYFDAGSVSLTGLALVATGRAGEAPSHGPGVEERALDSLEEAHRRLFESSIDAVQARAAAAARRTSEVIDVAERGLPAPVAGVVDDVQDAAGATLELADAAVDLAQRVTSPDLYLGVGRDLWDLVSG